MARRGLISLALALLLLFIVVPAGWAGEYHVYSCRTPTGLVAPTDGWAPSEHPAYDPTLNTCESGGGLIAALETKASHVSDTESDQATWTFKAPEGEIISEATLWRAGDNPGGGTEEASYLFWLARDSPTGPTSHIFDECIASKACQYEGNLSYPLASENRVVVKSDELNEPGLSFRATCGSPYIEPCPVAESDDRYDAEIELFAADIVLSQPNGPTVSAVSGGLAEDPIVTGTSDVAFHAADPGSGVYEAIVTVDGQPVEHQIVDEENGRCRSLGGTTDGLNAFLYTKPCPAEASADLPLDTVALGNGPHHLVVTVTDAAGNSATVLDREITVANNLPPGCAATGIVGAHGTSETVTLSAGWKGRHGGHLRARYGAAHTIEGRLADAAGVIANAPVEVCELPAYRGAPTTLLAVARTDAAGRWRITLSDALPSGTLRVAYRANPLQELPAALASLTLTVPAAVRLHVAPHRARSEGAIRFHGRLAGGPIPAGGKQLILEARSPGGHWLEFHVIRTGPTGTFAYRYRFRLPGPARYQFRAVSEAEADYPFAAGVSNVVRVREG
jgi:hypothetical protein